MHVSFTFPIFVEMNLLGLLVFSTMESAIRPFFSGVDIFYVNLERASLEIHVAKVIDGPTSANL